MREFLLPKRERVCVLRMERKLYEASLGGNVTSLIELLEEDPLLLDRIITGFYETPLHIAAMRGHVDFAKKILSTKPELASELDTHGYCPLHLASTKKNVDMVKVLIEVDPDVCCVTDQDGRTPLHLAAMKGRVEIMGELIRARPQAIKVLLDRRETILHLCVKHNRLEALKFLVDYLEDVQPSSTDHISHEEAVVSVNSKDIDGNTILHLAAARRQLEMIKYLLDNNIGVELNATNNKGFTAMDILTQSTEITRGFKDIEFEQLLRDAGVRSSNNQQLIKESNNTTDHHDQTIRQQLQLPEYWDKEKNTLMVVASLIATMAFQSVMNPPGGVWQGNADPGPTTVLVHNIFLPNGSPSPTSLESTYLPKVAGTSVAAYKDPQGYLGFMICNSIGFMAALSIIFLLISGLPVKRRSFVRLLMVVLWVSISFMALTYLVAMSWSVPKHYLPPLYIGLLPKDNLLIFYSLFRVVLIGWFGLLALVMVVRIILFSYLLFKLVNKKLNLRRDKQVARQQIIDVPIIK